MRSPMYAVNGMPLDRLLSAFAQFKCKPIATQQDEIT